MNRLRGTIAALVTAAVVGPLAQQAPVFRSGVEIVELDVSVMRRGRPVVGLLARDFTLTDDGVAQDIESVTLDQLPLSIILALDISGSVSGERLGHLLDAGDGLTRALHAQDRASLITFSHGINLNVPLTDDLNAVRSALHAIQPGGSTALRDAVEFALALRPRDGSRPLLLVFTDGKDNVSFLSEEAVLESARRSSIVIHAVRFDDDPFLDRLASDSGGRTWSATSDRQLRELFTKALEEMRARYCSPTRPAGVTRTGWHTLKVKLTKQRRGGDSGSPGYPPPPGPRKPRRKPPRPWPRGPRALVFLGGRARAT